MRQLYIDGKPAVIKSGSSFKFYRENIYFTEAEDYTLDVTLPLQGCPENLDIFTAIHRPEMSLVHLIGKKYPFHFISPPLDISGSAIVTEINEQEVKVQLLAGATGLDLETIGKDIYIDELDLGKAFDVTHPGIAVYDGAIRSGFYGASVSSMKSTYNNNPNRCVFFPIYSEGSDTVLNKHNCSYSTTRGESFSYSMGTDYDKFSAQPYLLLIIERVLNAIGYELNPDNAIAQSWQQNIFIANGRNEFKYANLLPHWTVTEFLKEVCLFCGVAFTKEGNVVNIIRKADNYADESSLLYLSEIIDEHTTEIESEDEGSKDPLTGNVGYDFDSIDPMLRLPDEVWNKANVIEPFSSESVMRQWAGSYSEDKAGWILSETRNHGVYAYIEDSEGFFLCEVDQVGSILRDGKRREIDVNLRIVPAKMEMIPVTYRYETDRGFASKVDAFYVPMLMTATSMDKIPDFSVNNAVNPNAEDLTPSKPERIEVAFNDTGEYCVNQAWTDPAGSTVNITIPLAVGIPYVREDEAYFLTLFTTTGTHKNLLLKPDTAMYNILNYGKKIDTRVKHCFQFLDNIDPNPKATFIIRGRKYACQKIEYTVEEQGLSPIKRGYFYEIND